MNAIGFRSLDASNLSFFANVKKEAGEDMKILPLIDEEEMTITHATFQKHYKFAILARVAPKDEKQICDMIITVLVNNYVIPAEFFEGGGMIPKCGLCVFPNTEHKATIRLWCSKQIGKNVIYELTVSSYKDAVPQPMENKPSQGKRAVFTDK
jgi:hypothetical protein